MQAGRLRTRVTIQKEVVTRDTFGAEVNPWVAVATVWASVLPAGRGNRGETFLPTADQMVAMNTHRVRVRRRVGISPKMRLVWGERVLAIESIEDPTGRGAELVLLCTEIVESTS